MVLITGNTGFVGCNLTPYMQRAGFKTIGVNRKPKLIGEISLTIMAHFNFLKN